MAAVPIDIQSQEEVPTSAASLHHKQSHEEFISKRRHKKHRYRKHGYHKSERDNSRRVEARAFLSSITLDSRFSPALDLDSIAHTPSGSPKARLRGSLVPASEERVTSHQSQLHEIAAHLLGLSHAHSPMKLTPSRSHDHDLNYSSYSNNMPFMVTRSTSLFESSSASTPGHDHLSKRVSLTYSKSMGGSGDASEEVHHCSGNIREWLYSNNKYGSRIVLMAAGSPFLVMSTLGYKKNEKFNLERPQQQRVRANSTSLQQELELDVELGTVDEVSLAHLFDPVYQLQTDSNMWSSTSQLGILQHRLYSLGASYKDVLDHPLPSSSGASFPWAWFREHHSLQDVLVHYHPLCIDNYEFFVGPNISTLSVQSYRVSIIQYAKASEIKKGINDQFSDTFPHIKITLSKLRSIKKELYNIAKEIDLDLAAISYSYVYFEKLVLMGKVNKSNRKMIAGVCLLLAAKFVPDIKKHEIRNLLDEISDTFRLSSEEIISHELSVLAALQFSLLTPIYQALTHHERLVEQGR